jgi:hypothetical protein
MPGRLAPVLIAGKVGNGLRSRAARHASVDAALSPQPPAPERGGCCDRALPGVARWRRDLAMPRGKSARPGAAAAGHCPISGGRAAREAWTQGVRAQETRARCAILVTNARAGRWIERRRLQASWQKGACALRAILVASAAWKSWMGGAGIPGHAGRQPARKLGIDLVCRLDPARSMPRSPG